MAVAFKTHEEMATGTRRVIYQCRARDCKHTWAHDYMIIPGRSYALYLRHDTEGKRVWQSDDYVSGCPQCHRQNMVSNEVKGTVTDHKCDAKCLNAKGPNCECSCGGLHHGEGFLRTH